MLGELKDTRVVIIGMGYLMEYLLPCHSFILGDNIKHNIIAVTVDDKDIERKNQVLPFKVILHDNKFALDSMQPDVIFFAPQPRYARQLSFTVLEPYYSKMRSEGRSLPDLYAFPPNPPGKFYNDLLGNDVNVVNILPNMESKIGGKDISSEGYTIITFPENNGWPSENVIRLKRYFKPIGGVVEVEPSCVIPVLAGKVVCHNISEVIFAICDSLSNQYFQIDYQKMASAMRYAHHEHHNYHPNNALPCSKDDIPEKLYNILKNITLDWYYGISKYLLEIGVSKGVIEKLITSELDIHLQAHQVESRSTLVYKTKCHATKGGVLEMGCISFDEIIKDTLAEAFGNYANYKFDQQWEETITLASYQMTERVSSHGMTLSMPSMSFDIVHHAVLFGMFARNAFNMAGDEGIKTIQSAVSVYGLERGGRMAQRARADGVEPSMENYLLYGEWQSEEGQMISEEIEMSPAYQTKVLRCEWNESWKQFGFERFGHYYCENVDASLVKGYTGQDCLEVKSFLSQKQPCCHFIWHGFDRTPQNNEKFIKMKNNIGSDHIRRFDFHTAHLYFTFARILKEELFEVGDKIVLKTKNDFDLLFSEQLFQKILEFSQVDFSLAD